MGPRLLPTVLIGLVFLLAPALGSSQGASPANGISTAATVVYVNVTATTNFGFTPAQFTVPPGATVHLAVTQLASYDHTFTLSSVANTTIPTTDTPSQLYAFFQAHPPIVNLSLGSVPGAVVQATFTAPPPGTYEFVCTVPTHFQSGMHGQMVSSTGSTSGSTSPSYTVEIVGIGIIVVAAVGVGVTILRRRSRPPPAPANVPNPEEKPA